MKGTIKVLNSSGHSVVEYDTDTGVVAEAEAILGQAAYSGSVVFDAKTKEPIRSGRGTAGQPGNRQILEEHEDVLVIPPMAGGR